MLVETVLGFINHILADENWARLKLKDHACKPLRLDLGKSYYILEISKDGYFKSGIVNAAPAVTIHLPEEALLRLLTDRSSLLAVTKISGSAEMAECIGMVFRNLNWDLVSDLAPLTGEIIAQRLVQIGASLSHWQRTQFKKSALNLTEYLTEEHPFIINRLDNAAFCRDVDNLYSDLDRLVKRVEILEKLHNSNMLT